ncbi:C-type lectin domain-containing protein [Caenorhabditis elegans]|uniref:C-type lectin domain-containing protein n=1 Tax=Caenorhabditis elegans TaxID=6239 RepID=O45272_CAEEL|nr:C-type lectin domain-containing protein [Caenorhabditis elegans]CAB02798.1 C-type lectin domain-containing protein [Caenorhabditis elegans]|eukprot:NP_506807.1 C-type LECtin [Caenorhabditis elegans]
MYTIIIIFAFFCMFSVEGCIPMTPPEEPVVVPVPVCPAGWFSFQRATGLWCYIIAKPPAAGWTSPQQYCQDNQMGSFVNGFESAAERTQFLQDALAANLAPSQFLHIGAIRSCAAPPCATTDPYVWQNGVSNDNNFANDYIQLYDGSGQCLSMDLAKNGEYNDITCDALTAYSCGKYAA